MFATKECGLWLETGETITEKSKTRILPSNVRRGTSDFPEIHAALWITEGGRKQKQILMSFVRIMKDNAV